MLETSSLAQLAIHVGLEHAQHAATIHPGARERGMGVAQQRRDVGRIFREEGDADAQANPERVAIDVDRIGDRRQQTLGESNRRGRLRSFDDND